MSVYGLRQLYNKFRVSSRKDYNVIKVTKAATAGDILYVEDEDQYYIWKGNIWSIAPDAEIEE